MLSNNSLEFCTQYGPEVQGLGTAAVNCEKKVHLFALKKFLGVEMRTPNNLVYGKDKQIPVICKFCGTMYTLLVKVNENGCF